MRFRARPARNDHDEVFGCYRSGDPHGRDSVRRKLRLGDDALRATRSSTWRSPAGSSLRLFFGGFGAWAATAPLNGAVVGNAVVKVDGNRKSVQHLDGGIVKELRVKEGDKVNAGDVLIVLDDTQARAEYEVLSQQYVVLRATEARLLTELDHGSELVMPRGAQDTPRTAISRASGTARSTSSKAAAPRSKASATSSAKRSIS